MLQETGVTVRSFVESILRENVDAGFENVRVVVAKEIVVVVVVVVVVAKESIFMIGVAMNRQDGEKKAEGKPKSDGIQARHSSHFSADEAV